MTETLKCTIPGPGHSGGHYSVYFAFIGAGEEMI